MQEQRKLTPAAPTASQRNPQSSYDAIDKLEKSGRATIQRKLVYEWLLKYIKDKCEFPTARELAAFGNFKEGFKYFCGLLY